METRRGPLTAAQQEIAELYHATRKAPWQNLHYWIGLQGELNQQALARAVVALQERHEPLRTQYVYGENCAEAVVLKHVPVPLSVENIHCSYNEVRQLASDIANRSFDHSAAPLWQVKLLKSSRNRYELLLCLDHLCVDGWSMETFVREFNSYYNAFVAGQRLALQPLRAQCIDGALDEQQRLQSPRGQAERDWWLASLGKPPAVPCPLPGGRPRRRQPYFRAARRVMRLGAELTSRIGNAGRRHRCSVFSVLLAALHAALHKHGGGSVPIVGTRMAAREAKTAATLGPFRNTVILRPAEIEGPSLGQLLNRASQTTLTALSHQLTPFNSLREPLSQLYGIALDDLALVMLLLDRSPFRQLALSGLRLVDIHRIGTLELPPELNAAKGPCVSELNRLVMRSHADLTRISHTR
jgi:hypothetical protein